MMAGPYLIAICGAGPVGMASALMLVRRGVDPAQIALIDARSLGQAISDPRSIAVSHGSRLLLEEIAAWPSAATTAIHQIHISQRGHFGRTLIDRAEQQVPALGYVTRYGELVDALAKACERAGLVTLRQVKVNACDEHADGVSLTLDDGSTLEAALAVQAEGGLFGQQDSRARQHDYRQSAVIARVAVSTPIAHRAYERFTDEGPLALLPQYDSGAGNSIDVASADASTLQYALVWCVRPEHAQALLALDDAAFLAQLGEAFGSRLGRFTQCSARASYKLGLNAEPRATGRTVAIGNAAQTLHPVAGQGLNLGLRDAAVLARLLAREATPAQLAKFVGERAIDRRLTVGLTDAMARAFINDGPLQTLLGCGLGALDVVAPARALLADLMMFGRR
jgi:2-octaprenyl-6-methoxyphenol hydroxylase